MTGLATKVAAIVFAVLSAAAWFLAFFGTEGPDASSRLPITAPSMPALIVALICTLGALGCGGMWLLVRRGQR